MENRFAREKRRRRAPEAPGATVAPGLGSFKPGGSKHLLLERAGPLTARKWNNGLVQLNEIADPPAKLTSTPSSR